MRVMKVIVDLKTWYAKGNVEIGQDEIYDPYLLYKRQLCCLGFCALAHGATQKAIRALQVPSSVADVWETWMVNEATESPLASLAIDMNDAEFEWATQPLEVRMGNLITIFAEGGDELEFQP